MIRPKTECIAKTGRRRAELYSAFSRTAKPNPTPIKGSAKSYPFLVLKNRIFVIYSRDKYKQRESETQSALDYILERLKTMCGGIMEMRVHEESGTKVTIFIPAKPE